MNIHLYLWSYSNNSRRYLWSMWLCSIFM